ncbi:hypothetical protein BVY04_00225, partial [bacterium M21]
MIKKKMLAKALSAMVISVLGTTNVMAQADGQILTLEEALNVLEKNPVLMCANTDPVTPDCTCCPTDGDVSTGGGGGGTGGGNGGGAATAAISQAGGTAVSRGSGMIDNDTFNHMFFASDYSGGEGVGGCQSCGASKAASNLLDVKVSRIHRYRDVTQRSSFGPGVFLGYDISLNLFMYKNQPCIDLFDPGLTAVRRLFLEGETFGDTANREVGNAEMLDANGIRTLEIAQAKQVRLPTLDGREYLFEVFSPGYSEYAGRLARITDRNGYATVLSYQVAADAQHSGDARNRWKLDTIRDANNRVLAFDYMDQFISGQPAIQRITLPNNEVVTYEYGTQMSGRMDSLTGDYYYSGNPFSDGKMQAINHPDGSRSTLTITALTGTGTAASSVCRLHYKEAASKATEKNVSAYMEGNLDSFVSQSGVEYINAAAHLTRLITKGDSGNHEGLSRGTENDITAYIFDDGEVAYAGFTYPEGKAPAHRVLYEGGARARFYDIAHRKHFTEWSFDNSYAGILGPRGANRFSGTLEGKHRFMNWRFYAANRQKRPPYVRRDDGQTMRYLYSRNNTPTHASYPDGTVEKFEHNQFRQITHHVDRLGRATKWTYDQHGNKLTKVVGLKKLRTAIPDGTEKPGLRYELYDQKFRSLPDFSSKTPSFTGAVNNIEISATDRDDAYAMVFEGLLNIETAGDYTFHLSSDDGSKLYINGELLIDNDGRHSATELNALTTLEAGKHQIRVEYFECYGNQQLSLKYQGADSADEVVSIPDTAFSYLTQGEFLEEIATTPETATYAWDYYPQGHTNQFLLRYKFDPIAGELTHAQVMTDNHKRTEYIYNDDHQLTTIMEPDDHGAGYHMAHSYTYTDSKCVSQSADALGRTATYDYDARGRLAKITYSDNSTELDIYGTGDDAALLLKHKDRNGNVTKYEYDTTGRKIKVIKGYSRMNEDGSAETLVAAHLSSVTGYTYLNGTDKVLTKVVDGTMTKYTYDFRPRLIETTPFPNKAAQLTPRTVYDAQNRLFATEDAYGRKTYYGYRDSDGKR